MGKKRDVGSSCTAAAVCAVVGLTGCGGGGGVRPNETATTRQAAQPEAIHRAAGASPRFGSVSQGSNVRNGVATDRVSIAYVPDSDGFHPVATIRADDGAVLRSNDNPRSVDVELPAGRIVQMTVDGPDQGNVPRDEIERLYTRADWKAAEAEEYRYLLEEHGEAEAREIFVRRYGGYPIPDTVPYERGSRPFSHSTFEPWVSPPESRRHPKGRAVNEVILVDVLDDSVRGPGHYTAVGVDALTDYPAAVEAGANDYLTWGSWYYFTITPTDLDFSYGAFADGAETAASKIPVTGTASYAGLTQALAIRGGTPSRGNLDDDAYWSNRVAHLRGDVNLQASFASGTVTGTIDNVRAFAVQGSDGRQGSEAMVSPQQGPDEPAAGSVDPSAGSVEPAAGSVEPAAGSDEPAAYFPSNVAIDLGTAPIEAGTFEGDARATSGLPGAAGKWGGQFFGTPGAGAAPPAAGGTWGVTQGTGDNDWKVVGAFGSWRE